MLQDAKQKLKLSLSSFPEGMDSLDVLLEDAAKHVPAYLKIVKTHLEQLDLVLQRPEHGNRSIDTIELAKPVSQLTKIFSLLEDGDLNILEDLYLVAKNWKTITANIEKAKSSQEETAA